ncbi:unnamed protein product [Prorocentrum cordatum]|uniref:Uncharacterized protein n=1 Tax=Prorocentrum cordatum TaxID=2364126 RepID=A0ABN9QRD9_9DINO|nr:unnamed protein product [Polarella glacialis]
MFAPVAVVLALVSAVHVRAEGEAYTTELAEEVISWTQEVLPMPWDVPRACRNPERRVHVSTDNRQPSDDARTSLVEPARSVRTGASCHLQTNSDAVLFQGVAPQSPRPPRPVFRRGVALAGFGAGKGPPEAETAQRPPAVFACSSATPGDLGSAMLFQGVCPEGRREATPRRVRPRPHPCPQPPNGSGTGRAPPTVQSSGRAPGAERACVREHF